MAGAQFVTGKEICVREAILSPLFAADGDTHDQQDRRADSVSDRDTPYYVFGATTENGLVYKDPALGATTITDPAMDQDVVGTYRYDPGHGW